MWMMSNSVLSSFDLSTIVYCCVALTSSLLDTMRENTIDGLSVFAWR